MIQHTASTELLHVPGIGPRVRLSLKHPAENTSHVVTIRHDELSGWIGHARRHGFGFDAESLDPPPQAA